MADTDLVRSEQVASPSRRATSLGPAGRKPSPTANGWGWEPTESTPRAATWRASSRLFSAVVPTSTARCSNRRRLQPCSSPSTNWIRGCGHGPCVLPQRRRRAPRRRARRILPGFNSEILVAPDDGVALIAFTNGSSGAMAWMPTELRRLLHHLLDVPDEAQRYPQHPEIWGEICGRYQLPGRISDLRGRVMMGGGVEVFLRGGQLMVRVLTPCRALQAFRSTPMTSRTHTSSGSTSRGSGWRRSASCSAAKPASARRQLTPISGDSRCRSSGDPPRGGRAPLTGAFGALAVATTARAVRRRSARHKAGQA